MSFLCRVLRKERLRSLPSLDTCALVTFLNPYSYLLARKNSELFERFDRVYPDGVILAKALGVIGLPSKRLSFDMTSLAPVVFRECLDRGVSLAVIGSELGVAEKAVAVWKTKFGRQLDVVYVRNGFFSNSSDVDDCYRDISSSGARVVIVGMGTPVQEQFLVGLVDSGWRGVGFTCGGFLHQTASKGQTYYPLWIDKLNLRWLYRMFDEPKLIKRYLMNYPIFIFAFVSDLFRR
ncbi:MAG: WecB/TagA/CpsF family glycosyltransferase [bacterium]|nr:WecB/TagA/CpsF family glycosyltransferase [bacterium]